MGWACRSCNGTSVQLTAGMLWNGGICPGCGGGILGHGPSTSTWTWPSTTYTYPTGLEFSDSGYVGKHRG